MGEFLQDVRFGWRVLRKNPGFTAVAVLTLALGIGANSAIFSMVHAILLQPLPFPNSGRLVMVWETDPNREVARGVVAPAELLDWRQQAHSFESLGAWRTWFYNLSGGTEPEQVWGMTITPNFFHVLEVSPSLGRSFLPSEGAPGHEQEVILSHGLWLRRFGGDAGVLGRSLTIDQKPYTIVGVMPAGFSLFGTLRHYDIWMPFAWNPAQLRRDAHSVIVMGRLAPGVSVAQAQAEMSTLLSREQREYSDEDQGLGIRVVGMRGELTAGLRPALLVLMFAVGFVLLIACANVANLLLARAATRQREVAVRAVLGAGRMRLFRQLLTESLMLALLGGLAGIAAAVAGLRVLLTLLPRAGSYGEIPHPEWIRINVPVLLFTLGIAVVTGIIFGLAPALQNSRADFSESMKEGGRGGTVRRGRAVRSALVISETALALVLLVGAGLLIESFVRLLKQDIGFRSENMLTLQVWMPPAKYPSESQVVIFVQQVRDRLAALPGVRSVSAINFLPLTGWGDFSDFSIEGRPAPKKGQEFTSQYRVIDPGYFQTMGMALKAGRNFTAADSAGAPGVAVISESLAREYWPGEYPIGKRFRLDLPDARGPWQPQARTDWLTIVGLAGDVRESGLGEAPTPQIYLPFAQNPSRILRFVLHTDGDPATLAGAVRHAVASVNGDQPVSEVETMGGYVSDALSQRRLNMSLLAAFAVLAIFLAAIGIYGVVAYSVAQRTHEIGIRMALGAQPSEVLRLIVGQAMRLVLAGIGFGLLASLFLMRLLASALFGVRANDPVTFAAVAVMLAVVALVASYLPARKAMRVDPMIALRYE
jgi:putative ABC transport system permease protein